MLSPSFLTYTALIFNVVRSRHAPASMPYITLPASGPRRCDCPLSGTLRFVNQRETPITGAMALAPPSVPSHGYHGCPREGADDFGHRLYSRSACLHHTKSASHALSVSLVEPGADLSARYLPWSAITDRFYARHQRLGKRKGVGCRPPLGGHG